MTMLALEARVQSAEPERRGNAVGLPTARYTAELVKLGETCVHVHMYLPQRHLDLEKRARSECGIVVVPAGVVPPDPLLGVADWVEILWSSRNT